MHNKLLILFLLSVFVSSCIDDRAPSGISSTVFYAQGDCMPPINENGRNYSLYNGKVYVVESSLVLIYNENNFDTLKTLSFETEAINGGFSVLVPPGSYYVMPDTMYSVSSENLVVVHPDDLIDREFKFYKCTSY